MGKGTLNAGLEQGVRKQRIWLLAILSVHAALLAWSATRNSPTFHEVPHVPAGLSHLLYGRFELYRVNPPLPRTVAAIPLLFLGPATDWTRYSTHPTIRSELRVGADFVRANGDRCFWLYTVARWACIPFSIIGAIACFHWAADLYGLRSGLWAATLWCFSPFVLAHASLVMPDAPAAALAVVAMYSFWKWLQRPSWSRAIVSGVIIGTALLTKLTLLVLLVVCPFVWAASRLPTAGSQHWFAEGAKLIAAILAAAGVVNAGYLFDHSFKPLGLYAFVSAPLTRESAVPPFERNRFADTCLASIPVPLPEQFVLGIDQQKADFEHPSPCYLRGKSKEGGWWYFYLYALGVKVPVGTMILLLMSVVCRIGARRGSNPATDELALWTVPLAILALVSSQTALTVHARYALPILPFLFVRASKIARLIPSRHVLVSAVAIAALVWSCTSSLFAFPHDVAYFNELAGGPRAGPFHLLDSNCAWGQDLLFLRDWAEEHPGAKPLHVLVRPWIDPRYAGIESVRPWLTVPRVEQGAAAEQQRLGPTPGWYAVDVTFVRGAHALVHAADGLVAVATETEGNVLYLRGVRPAATAGYSLYIYHLDAETADAIQLALLKHPSSAHSSLSTERQSCCAVADGQKWRTIAEGDGNVN